MTLDPFSNKSSHIKIYGVFVLEILLMSQTKF